MHLRVERAERVVVPDVEQAAESGIAICRGRRAVDDDDASPVASSAVITRRMMRQNRSCSVPERSLNQSSTRGRRGTKD